MRLLRFPCKEKATAIGYNFRPDLPASPAGRLFFAPMAFHVLGINHHSAPLEVREKVAFAPENQATALAELAGQPGVAEAVLVSTCNRTEIYCSAEDPGPARTWLCAAAERVGLDL